MKVCTVCNQKGGAGKTTTAAALAAGLARRGLRVLAVDTDAQHSLTAISAAQAVPCGLFDVIDGKKKTAAAILPTAQGFDILAGDIRLSSVPKGYALDTLRGVLASVSKCYDFCIIDTPPALSVVTLSALAAADAAIVTAQPDVLSLYGLDQVSETIEAVRPYNPALSVGVLLTRYSDRRNLDKTMRDAISERAQQMGAFVYNTTIRAGVSVPEAQLLRLDIYTASPRAGVTADYLSFIDEFLKGV